MKSNSLIYKTTKEHKDNYEAKEKTTVTIRLNDECKNGHQDFAITCDIKEQRKNGHWIEVGGGAAHEHILKLFPELKIFVDLHLCDFNGSPMHAIANGYYHLKNEPEILKSSHRLTDNEIQYLLTNTGDQLHFTLLLEDMGIIARWKDEAKKAIKELEKLTGKEFLNDSKRSQYKPLTEGEKIDLQAKIKNGYYTPEQIKERKELKTKQKNQAKKDQAKKDQAKKITDAGKELMVKLYMIDNSPVDNYIYHNHTNKIMFNWLSYDKQISQEDFIDFVDSVTYDKLPEGITFAIEE